MNSSPSLFSAAVSKPQNPRQSLLDSLFLTFATIALLVPFSGKAFNIDDPLFVWTAQQITQHPLNPYGFHLVWYVTDLPIFVVTKNPPLASYFGAIVGMFAGWSERAWHIAFLLPAIGVVLGTYRLAQRFTASPLIAAAATLVAPGFLVSATTVMCDVTMLALWIWAIIFWLDALDSRKPLQFLASALLIALCALTKYFGACLIPLLLVYSLAKRRNLRGWILYLLVPVAALLAYQFWTKSLYGRGLLWDAAEYTRTPVHAEQGSHFTNTLIGLSFIGGCALPTLLFAPLFWARNRALTALASFGGLLAGIALAFDWLHLLVHDPLIHSSAHWQWIAIEFGLLVVGGILTLGFAIADFQKSCQEENRAANSLLLALWIFGTFIFAAFLNWTINARSVLPLIPAAAILLARRCDELRSDGIPRLTSLKIAIPMALSTIISITVAAGDMALANSARSMARTLHQRALHAGVNLLFEGHWGFQYYMQNLGAQPLVINQNVPAGSLLATPENTTNTFPISSQLVAEQEIFEMAPHSYASTMAIGAGFYSSAWGPLPFSFGPAPPERYLLQRLQIHQTEAQAPVSR